MMLAMAFSTWAKEAPWDPSRARGPVRTNVANPEIENRVHDASKICMNITNYGYFGNSAPTQGEALDDPCPPGTHWAPQAEFPCGSDQQYLYQAGLWIGALIVEEGYETPRVSVGTDGWFNPSINEFWPGEGEENGIIEISNRQGFHNCFGEPVYDPYAVSDQDFIATYADTLTDDFWLVDDPVDGVHRPLGIRVTQKSYALSQAFAEDFILIDYEIENIASNFLKNVYVGLYVDSDCGPSQEQESHTDDICGFRQYRRIAVDGRIDSVFLNAAYIVDNDGRPPATPSGPLNIPHVTGTRVIRGPNPRLETAFNWWVSRDNEPLDFGPSWEIHCHGDEMGWTSQFGTPVGDLHKYQVLSDEEFDFDQIMVDEAANGQVPPQIYRDPVTGTEHEREWCTEDLEDPQGQGLAADIADGYDTRYLLSWGPLGIFDYIDNSGRRIYRLNPGEKFNMTLAYVAGEYFHDPNNPQPTDTDIDSSLFNFDDFDANLEWAREVYDNRMVDTPQHDFGEDGIENTGDAGENDGILDTGDGWYGEDVGTDGLYAEIPPGVDSVRVVYFYGTKDSIFAGWYSGPDADSTEGNGLIDPVNNNLLGANTEDEIIPSALYYDHEVYRFWDMGWMHDNGRLDPGDGLPDFTGPPPPPIPALLHVVPNTINAAAHFGGVVRTGDHTGALGYELTEDAIILRWSKNSSEDSSYRDPFSRVQDFEGYSIHFGNVNLDNSFSLLATFDKIDYAYYGPNGAMLTIPVETMNPDTLPQTIVVNNVVGTLGKVGPNTGFAGENGHRNIVMNDSTYEYRIPAHKLAPRYYSVTATDFGDPGSGLGPLATRPSANAVFIAPAGTPKKKVSVVPNPYRAYQDYTQANLGISWENQNDGTDEFFAQQDRRLEFTNLPDRCLIRIFTVAGDLVAIVPHNTVGDNSRWPSATSERWDLNSRNNQQVVSGIYMFSVEDLSDHSIEVGKFVIIR